jgi:hypothetical protein
MNTRSLSALLTVSFACLLLAASCAKPSGGGPVTQCGTGQTACGTECTNTATDNANCGGCGKACGQNQVCQNGACACGSGLMLCSGACVSSDANHCGGCNPCPNGQLCANNTCTSMGCPSGTTQCGSACVTTGGDNTLAHCGGCNACPTGATACNSGTCGCSGGQTLCGSSCVDTNSSNANCGGCGRTCTGTCTNGTCVTSNPGTAGNSGSAGNGAGGNTSGSAGNGAGGNTSGSAGNGAGGSTGGSTTGTGGRGGTTGSGGTGGSGAGGTTGTGGSTGTAPAGYYKTADWGVTSADWHGCTWTGKDSTVMNSTTAFTQPTSMDFTSVKEGGPYEAAGTVYNDYNAVALLGFNLNEAPNGSSTQCKYNAAAAMQNGPPAATIPSTATGIAISWSEKKAPPTSVRIQVQDVDGATNPAHVWCYTITDPQGPSFAPFAMFNSKCWDGTGTKFDPKTNPIDAIAFLVPGTVANTAPFDFTITGFAPGTSKTDAPGGMGTCGTIAGSLGSTTASQAASFARAAVTGTDCKTYIVQNNNWGNATGSTQLVNYTGTGFTVQSSSGSGSSAPASFPSTYVGGNGNVANGTYNTWADTGLPKQISGTNGIQSAMTSFGWSGGKSGGQFNATYDVWFAKTSPTAGSYNDGISGFIMVWLYQPSNFHPIGGSRNASFRTASIAGKNWSVWVGPRGQGQGSTGGVNDGSGRPVISYVIQGSALPSLSFDLKDFISDAVSHGATDMASDSGITQAFSSSWYLTDVFAGFEIWSGGDATNLKSTGFQIAVK